MPMYDVNQKKKVNYYGVFTLWAAILILASYFVLYTSGCGEVGSTEVQVILAATFVLGILLFLLSFCNIAVRLFHRKCFFYLIVLHLLLLALALLYAAYQTLVGGKCERTLYYERNYSLLLNSGNNSNNSSGNGNNITTADLPVVGHHEIIRKTFQSMNSRRSDHYAVSAVLDLIASLLFAGSAYAFRHRI